MSSAWFSLMPPPPPLRPMCSLAFRTLSPPAAGRRERRPPRPAPAFVAVAGAVILIAGLVAVAVAVAADLVAALAVIVVTARSLPAQDACAAAGGARAGLRGPPGAGPVLEPVLIILRKV